jgi:hypothetical protein
MKSVEIKVPRDLIKKFYQHPEPYGDGNYVVDLNNDMYTDVFYREEGDFITITNDKDLISFLKINQMKPREYFFKNGVYSLRNVQDCDIELIEDWKKIIPVSFKLSLPKEHNLPAEFMLCFYWIEVGKATIIENKINLDVFEKDLIHMIDIELALDLLKENI